MPTPPVTHDHFLSLLKEHERALRKVCWVYTRSDHDRDDLLQEMVVQLWKSFGKYDRTRVFSTWMYRVALNVAIDFQRKQRRRVGTSTMGDAQETIPAAAGDAVTKQQQLHELRELLDQQNEADRVLLLLYLEGHSLREIGEVLGISETNVSTRLHRLKQSLRQIVQQQGT